MSARPVMGQFFLSLFFLEFCYRYDYHNLVNCDHPGECSPEKDCLR